MGLIAWGRGGRNWSTYSPEALEDVQMDIVLGELMVDSHVALGLGEEGRVGHGGGCGAPSMKRRRGW
jgi:hypothetical protein